MEENLELIYFGVAIYLIQLVLVFTVFNDEKSYIKFLMLIPFIVFIKSIYDVLFSKDN